MHKLQKYAGAFLEKELRKNPNGSRYQLARDFVMKLINTEGTAHFSEEDWAEVIGDNYFALGPDEATDLMEEVAQWLI